MAKNITDGRHTISGYEVYIENGKIVRGMKRDPSGIGKLPAYVYRSSKYGGYDRESGGLTVSAFRSGVRRGTISLM